MKKQIGLRVEAHLKDGLDDQAARSGRSATTILEEYIAAGLARDSGELVEQHSLPAIRQVVREEVGKVMSQLYDKYEAAMVNVAQRDTNRLAALIVKAARYAGIGQNLVYSFMMKSVSQDFATKSFEAAKERIGKEIARPDEQR